MLKNVYQINHQNLVVYILGISMQEKNVYFYEIDTGKV